MRRSPKMLVHFEEHESVLDAIECVKRWARAWKIALIHEKNPEWRDLLEIV
jgi:putative endonuclease